MDAKLTYALAGLAAASAFTAFRAEKDELRVVPVAGLAGGILGALVTAGITALDSNFVSQIATKPLIWTATLSMAACSLFEGEMGPGFYKTIINSAILGAVLGSYGIRQLF